MEGGPSSKERPKRGVPRLGLPSPPAAAAAPPGGMDAAACRWPGAPPRLLGLPSCCCGGGKSENVRRVCLPLAVGVPLDALGVASSPSSLNTQGRVLVI